MVEVLSTRVELIRAKVEILKLKANDYSWQCETPKDVRAELDRVLAEIDQLLYETPKVNPAD